MPKQEPRQNPAAPAPTRPAGPLPPAPPAVPPAYRRRIGGRAYHLELDRETGATVLAPDRAATDLNRSEPAPTSGDRPEPTRAGAGVFAPDSHWLQPCPDCGARPCLCPVEDSFDETFDEPEYDE